ncbi:hypothetical protein MYX07_03915 [Patescibacteria group bacterium AH-259-L07]|nr:hypothetical protein [Patescibacteria group bacterium AH-259-L07]
MRKHKILYGVCGIGSGHTYRQLPIIEHFLHTSRIVIFAYGESYKYYSYHFRNKKSVTIVRVAVPFYVGSHDGLDFEETARLSANQQDYLRINSKAFVKAFKILGKPDLVITDYEPVSAQYAYAYNVPLVTIDQQSKYLSGNFPSTLNGFIYRDEIMRLRMFFPHAGARIATSFFSVPAKGRGVEVVHIYPPILKDSIVKIDRNRHRDKRSILVYISSQREFMQPIGDVASICASQKNVDFHIFTSNIHVKNLKKHPFHNIHFYKPGNPRFYKVLQECTGIISTAGHTLVSEAMYLGIPVYAIPLAVYEQHMNAHIIDKHRFGISYPGFDKKRLSYFIENNPRFVKAIKQDKNVLLRGPGQQRIIKYLERQFL